MADSWGRYGRGSSAFVVYFPAGFQCPKEPFELHRKLSAHQHHEFRLGKWHVTPLRGVINGPEGSRRITPKSMDVLLCLASRAGEVVDRETLQNEVWEGRVFGDDPLNRCIAELRRQLGDRAGSRDYIETIPKRGYRLVAPITPVADPLPDAKRGEPRRHLRFMALAGLVVLAAVGAWRLSQDVVPSGDIAVAVLPFADLSESGKQYFADGVHEELIGELSQIGALVVRSRTSTLQYRERDVSVGEIARALEVDVIVDGSVRQEGDRVRVAAQLVRATSDENLWADSIERSLSVANLFSIQNEIAQEIAGALELTLGGHSAPSGPQLPTKHLDAYDAFMLGKFHYRRQLPGDIRESVRRFERAVELDPSFVEAWDWLAYAYNHAATSIGYLPPRDAYPKARAAALRALELDPGLATALSILGYIRAVYDRDWVGAVADLERALELDPKDSGTVWSLAHVYAILGRHDEAIGLAHSFADEFDMEGRNHLEVANRLLDAGRYQDAVARLDLALNRGAEPAMVADARGVALLGLGQVEAAAAAFEFAVDAKKRHPGTVGRLAFAYAQSGRRNEAVELLDELLLRADSEPVSSLALATIHAGLGNKDRAIEEVETAAALGGRETLGLSNDLFLQSLRGEPAFDALVAELKLPTASDLSRLNGYAESP